MLFSQTHGNDIGAPAITLQKLLVAFVTGICLYLRHAFVASSMVLILEECS
jgi:hypothetical protein